MTYLIAIGGFAHVIVGSAEAFLLLLDGQVGVLRAFAGYLLPALVGNIIGGTALFSLLAYAQVREEIE
jgi:formate/nitrite transporter FocA (FNT family)